VVIGKLHSENGGRKAEKWKSNVGRNKSAQFRQELLRFSGG